MKKTIVILVALFVVGIGLFGGRRGYRAWKTSRAMTNARLSAAKPNFDETMLWLRKALAADGNNADAIRAMGELSETMRSPSALVWRKRLVEVEPDSITNRLALARVALQFRELPTAKLALDGIAASGDKSVAYLNALAEYARATGAFVEAENNLAQALQIEPGNPVLQLQLAMLRVQRSDPVLAAEGKMELERLRTNPAVGTTALRQLVLEAFGRSNYSRATLLVDELLQLPGRTFGDRILRLEIFNSSQNPAFQSSLSECQKLAGTNSLQIVELAGYMLRSRSPKEAIRWLDSLSSDVRTNMPVCLAVSDAYMAGGNWIGLHQFVSSQYWGELEYRRHAVSARALREQGLTTAAKGDWGKAMRAAEGRLDRLVVLQGALLSWNWPVELEEVLRAIVNRYPSEFGSGDLLAALLQAQGNSRGLLSLYIQLLKERPASLDLKNNVASTALLLGAMELKPHQLAKEVYEVQQTNAFFTSTYAYALHLQGKSAEGLRIMQSLNKEALENSSISGYYGLLLASQGEAVRSRRYLELGAKARLLPEEVRLFQQALLGL